MHVLFDDDFKHYVHFICAALALYFCFFKISITNNYYNVEINDFALVV